MEVVKFEKEHINGLRVHEYMKHIENSFDDEYGDTLAAFPSYTAIVNGEVIACAGMVQTGVYRWQAWALMSEKTKDYMIPITRAMNHYISYLNTPRIETHVRSDFKAGQRWMKMLGFNCETPEPMKNWGDDGYDYYLYARVK